MYELKSKLTVWGTQPGLGVAADARTVAGVVGHVVDGLLPAKSKASMQTRI
jgi:hypothetical protein